MDETYNLAMKYNYQNVMKYIASNRKTPVKNIKKLSENDRYNYGGEYNKERVNGR